MSFCLPALQHEVVELANAGIIIIMQIYFSIYQTAKGYGFVFVTDYNLHLTMVTYVARQPIHPATLFKNAL